MAPSFSSPEHRVARSFPCFNRARCHACLRRLALVRRRRPASSGDLRAAPPAGSARARLAPAPQVPRRQAASLPSSPSSSAVRRGRGARRRRPRAVPAPSPLPQDPAMDTVRRRPPRSCHCDQPPLLRVCFFPSNLSLPVLASNRSTSRRHHHRRWAPAAQIRARGPPRPRRSARLSPAPASVREEETAAATAALTVPLVLCLHMDRAASPARVGCAPIQGLKARCEQLPALWA